MGRDVVEAPFGSGKGFEGQIDRLGRRQTGGAVGIFRSRWLIEAGVRSGAGFALIRSSFFILPPAAFYNYIDQSHTRGLIPAGAIPGQQGLLQDQVVRPEIHPGP